MFKMNPENMADWRLNKLVEICDTYPNLKYLVALRDMFFKIYQCKDKDSAWSAYCEWKHFVPKIGDDFADMRRLALRTFKTWGKEIFNYFDVEGRKTNATTERLNGAIKSMQNMGRGYSYEVLRAKMLFGSATSKAPLYQRPSRLLSQEDKEAFNDTRYLLYCPDIHDADDLQNNKPFEVNPVDGGGVIEIPGYYYGKEEGPHPLSGYDLIMFNEMHMHDEVKSDIPMVEPEPKVRNPELELVQNGGATIDGIIKYYQEHGECI